MKKKYIYYMKFTNHRGKLLIGIHSGFEFISTPSVSLNLAWSTNNWIRTIKRLKIGLL